MTYPDKLALASRAEQAGGPDRGLDRDIMLMLGWSETGVFGAGRIKQPRWVDPAGQTTAFNPEQGPIYNYTASLDAITALIAEKLPGWTWGVFDDGTAWVWPNAQRDLLRGFQGKASTPCNGLVAAFLRALASTEDQP